MYNIFLYYFLTIILSFIIVYTVFFFQLESCLPRPEILSGYPSLLDATIFHVVWRQIDPEPQYHPAKLVNVDETALPNARAKNFDYVVRNLKALYEEELNQTLLAIPDCLVLGHAAGK